MGWDRYEYLDARTRRLMLDEMYDDIAHNRLHISPYLSGQGLRDYPQLLREAIETGSDETLAAALNQQRRLQRTFQRAKRRAGHTAGYTTVAVPANAAEVLAESEFNRYYVRALAQRAIDDGIAELVVFEPSRLRTRGQNRSGWSRRPSSQTGFWKICARIRAN